MGGGRTRGTSTDQTRVKSLWWAGTCRKPCPLVRDFQTICLLGYDIPTRNVMPARPTDRGSMANALLRSFNDGTSKLTARIVTIYALLIAANAAAWAWALVAFHDHPLLIGTCFLAYS